MAEMLSDFGHIIGLNGSSQVAVMPTYSTVATGTIVQYVGSTDANYTNGYFYKATASGWEVVDVQGEDTDKADKVDSATAGNLAGLDASGNLTDAGWSANKTITSASGNPISISGLKSNQLAIGPIITLEPIQAGSGDPSPNNIRAISGYDKIEVLSCRKNLFNPDGNISLVRMSNNNGTFTNTSTDSIDYFAFSVIATDFNENIITYNSRSISSTGVHAISISLGNQVARKLYIKHNGTNTDLGLWYSVALTGDITVSLNVIACNPSSVGGLSFKDVQIEQGSWGSTFEPYTGNQIQLTLSQTIYGATWHPENGELIINRKYIDLGNFNWILGTPWNVNGTVGMIAPSGENAINYYDGGFICSKYRFGNTVQEAQAIYNGNSVGIAWGNDIHRIVIYDPNFIDKTAEEVKALLAGTKLAYKLETPYTIQLTPHEISLLKDYAYVSTNGTNIALDYHNGELASLGDVAQLGQTVNELGNEFAKGDLYASPIIRSVPWLPHATRALSSIYIDNSSKTSDESAFKDAIAYVSSNLPDAKGYEGVTLIYVKAPTNVASIYMTPYGQNYCSGIIISFNNIIMFRYGLGSWNWDILKQW